MDHKEKMFLMTATIRAMLASMKKQKLSQGEMTVCFFNFSNTFLNNEGKKYFLKVRERDIHNASVMEEINDFADEDFKRRN